MAWPLMANLATVMQPDRILPLAHFTRAALRLSKFFVNGRPGAATSFWWSALRGAYFDLLSATPSC